MVEAQAEGRPSDVGAAFDAVAADYDTTWGSNPVGLLFRQTVHDRLARLFAPGARVLDLGCGTGEDALFLAARGIHVTGIDASAGMLARARAKMEARGLAPSVRLVHARLEEMPALDGPFDGACSSLGALNCVDLPEVGRRLATMLRPGARLLFAIMGPRPLPASLRRALRAAGPRRADGSVVVGGRPVEVRYWSGADVGDAFGAAFIWRPPIALGVCVPGPGDRRWVEAHPQAFGALAMVERLVRGLPGLRERGDHLLIEGARV
jgi:ubiquinone/menaquinone biosynthesis C-methylase UbiE